MDTDPAPNAAQPKSRRRWFQYSLRTMLVAVAALCVWFAILAKRVEDQKRAVAAIEAVGGKAVYDFEWPFTYPFAEQPPGPVWLRKLLGDDYFRTAVGAVFQDGQDEDLEKLRDLSVVKVVMLEGDRFTDNALVRLEAYPELEYVHLICPGVTDAGLSSLEKLPKLRSLALWANERVTDRGIAGLKKLHALQSISGANISEEAIDDLKRAFPNLQVGEEP